MRASNLFFCALVMITLSALGAQLTRAQQTTNSTAAQTTTAAASASAEPCRASQTHRQFDFWVGEWDVENPQGKPAGTSSVQLILGDCVVFENWTGARGYTGKSFNFYDARTQKWKQVWVDDRGGSLEFTGEFRDGAMRYTGEESAKDGKVLMNRLTFFPLAEGRVRQLWEQSADQGKTWSTVFDGTYIRKK